MAYFTTEGIVLKRSDYSESSQIVTLFTRDFGRLHGIAKGAKRPRKGLPATLDLLSRVHLVFIRKPPGQLHLFTEWTTQENYLRLRDNLDTLYYGLYVAELLLDLTVESEDSSALYTALDETLRALAETQDPVLTICQFEVNLLSLLGHMPEVKKCVACGRSLQTNLARSSKGGSPPTQVRFSPRDGGVLCWACPATATSCLVVSNGALASITALLRPVQAMSGTNRRDPRSGPTMPPVEAGDPLARRLRISEPLRGDVRRVLNACLRELLGREPRMFRFTPALAATERSIPETKGRNVS